MDLVDSGRSHSSQRVGGGAWPVLSGYLSGRSDPPSAKSSPTACSSVPSRTAIKTVTGQLSLGVGGGGGGWGWVGWGRNKLKTRAR